MNIIWWNVNGIRAVVKKDFFDSIPSLNPDMLCLQKTKAQDNEVENALLPLNVYQLNCNLADKKGYSGTALLNKSDSIKISHDMGIIEHDTEGPVL
ncbi:MAG: hypothetical protein KAJ23_12695 [Maribacter sp.]|nr:hypothetical protein [Maribacter sp.]